MKAKELVAPDVHARIQEVSQALANESDQLNADIEAVEHALSRLKLGVRAEQVMVSDDEGWARSLVYGKDGKTWRLLLQSGTGDEDDEVVALINASRELRLRALEFLPALLEKLLAAADNELQRVRQTRGIAREFAAAITPQSRTAEK